MVQLEDYSGVVHVIQIQFLLGLNQSKKENDKKQKEKYVKPYNKDRLLKNRECNDHGKGCGIFQEESNDYTKKNRKRFRKAEKKSARQKAKRDAVAEMD